MKTVCFEINVPKMLFAKALQPICPGIMYSRLMHTGRMPDEPLPSPNWLSVYNRLCKKSVLFLMFAMLTAILSGCIISKSPDTPTMTVLRGSQQVFKVIILPPNASYVWTLDSEKQVNTTNSYQYTPSGGSHELTVTATHFLGTDKQTWSIVDLEASQVINSSGGTVAVTDPFSPLAGTQADIPAGALATPVTITISQVTAPPDLPGQTAGPCVDFGPEGTAFTGSVELSLPYADANDDGIVDGTGVSEDFVKAYYYNKTTSAWEDVMVIDRDKALNLVHISVMHLSEYTTGVTGCVAEAGADINLRLGNMARLDGSGSSNPDGDPLTFVWTITSAPPGSMVELSDPNIFNPEFTPDLAGEYTIALIVNDGELFSAPDTVIINAYVTNHAPSAEAGSDINLYLGYIAPLDGNGSSDPDGDQLIFVWTITSAPPGSISILSDPNIANPTFMPDVIGTYTFTLIVNDGELFSAPDTVTITVPNRAPTAEAGADINLSLGSVTSLNGNGSYDPDGDPLTFVWTITSAPPGSMAALSNSTIINPTFQPDVIGTYTITLIVSDGTLSSAADTLTITVSGS